jgi:tetratricopeptide (TPR) repeat protein
VLARWERAAALDELTAARAEAEACVNDASGNAGAPACAAAAERLTTALTALESGWGSDRSCHGALADAYGVAGRLARKQGDLPASVRDFQRMAWYEPQNASHYGRLSEVLIDLERWHEASRYAQLAVQLAPDQWQAHRVQARAAAAAGDLDAAREAYAEAIRLAPGKERAALQAAVAALPATSG